MGKIIMNGVSYAGGGGSGDIPIATTETAGIVKPDGSTITIDTDGTIHGNSSVTEQTVADWGFTKNSGDYNKPTNGIPKTDLDSSVQASLGKADTALQTEQYTGTYSKPSTGIPKSDLSSAVQSAITNVAHYSTSSTFVAPTNRDADTLGGEAPSYYAKESEVSKKFTLISYATSSSNPSVVTPNLDGYTEIMLLIKCTVAGYGHYRETTLLPKEVFDSGCVYTTRNASITQSGNSLSATFIFNGTYYPCQFYVYGR